MYDSKFVKHLGKLQMHWIGTCVINSITTGGAVQLQQLDGVMLLKLVNANRLKPYKMGPEPRDV